MDYNQIRYFTMMLLDESTLRKITRLALMSAHIRRGALKGARRSQRHGSSATFADYRPYVPGDDLRRVDWNIYARLDRPFLKLFEEEEDQSVYLLLDCSGSMDWSGGESHKFTYAKKLSAALGAIALHGGDGLSLVPLQKEGKIEHFRSSTSLPRLFSSLEALQAGGASDLGRALRQVSPAILRPGLVILISDLLCDFNYEAGFAALQARGQELVVVHLLAPDELDPPLAGDLQLTDVESGATLEVSLDPVVLEGYRRRRAAWQDQLRAVCARRAIFYLPANSGSPWERLILSEMRRLGVVR